MAKIANTETLNVIEQTDSPQFPYVIHPLDDLPEEKCSPEGMGTMKLSRFQQATLLVLRGYIFLMITLVAIKAMTLAGWVHLFGA